MTMCDEYLQEDVDLSGVVEGSNPTISAFNDPLEKIAKFLVENQQRLEWTEHYLHEEQKRNHELLAKIKCLELENKLLNQMIEKQIGRGDR